MKHTIKHDLAPDQLHLAVRKFADEYCRHFAEYQTTADWVADDKLEVRFRVKGISLSGSLKLLPKLIEINMDVPLPFMLFKSRAVKAIEDEVRPWLERAARGELEG